MYNAGSYALVILSEDRLRLPIGKLGTHDFPPGYYTYVGSALRGLNGRLKRHLVTEKSLHWPIDYLLLQATVVQIWYSLSKKSWNVCGMRYWQSLLGQRPLSPALAAQIAGVGRT